MASLPLCLPPATSLLSTEITIKDIWLDTFGLKKSINFLHYCMWKYLYPSFAIDISKKANTLITFVKLIIVCKSFIINVRQDFEFTSESGDNLRKSSISDVWQGFEFVFVVINYFRKKIHIRCLTRFWTHFILE